MLCSLSLTPVDSSLVLCKGCCLGCWRIPRFRNLDKGVLSLLKGLWDLLQGKQDEAASELTWVLELEGGSVNSGGSSLLSSSTKSSDQFQCNALAPRWTIWGLASVLRASVGQSYLRWEVPNQTIKELSSTRQYNSKFISGSQC